MSDNINTNVSTEKLTDTTYNIQNKENTINLNVECSLVKNTELDPEPIYIARVDMKIIESSGAAAACLSLWRKVKDYKTFTNEKEAKDYTKDVMLKKTYNDCVSFAKDHDCNVNIRSANKKGRKKSEQ